MDLAWVCWVYLLQEMVFAIVMMLLSITVFNYVVGAIGTHVMRCGM